MDVRVSPFPLQRILQALPRPLRRIKAAQFLASFTGGPYHRLSFDSGTLIGNVRDVEIANSLVRGTFQDYGYFQIARRLLGAGGVHVDLGANYGFHTFGLVSSPLGTSFRYVLIDANPDCVGCLRESAKLYPHVLFEIFHAAAAVSSGEMTFSFAQSHTGSGAVGRADTGGLVEVQVPTVTLDDLFEHHGIVRIDLLKMDIEGSEPFAMQGLSRLLSAHRVGFIYFEVNPACLARLGATLDQLFESFTRHGYRLFWPHDSVDWILQTYGPGVAKTAELERFIVHGRERHPVIAFDRGRCRQEQFGQCDLLAIAPECRIEAAPLR